MLKNLAKFIAFMIFAAAPAQAANDSGQARIFSGYIISYYTDGFVPGNINQAAMEITVQSDCDKTTKSFELDFYEPVQAPFLNNTQNVYLPSYYLEGVWHLEMPISTMQLMTEFLEDHNCVNTKDSSAELPKEDTKAVLYVEYCETDSGAVKILPATVSIFERGIHGAPNNPCTGTSQAECTPSLENARNVVPRFIAPAPPKSP